MQHNHYLVLQTANYDFFLQICCQNKFSSLVKFPKELFITIHSFLELVDMAPNISDLSCVKSRIKTNYCKFI